MGALMHRTEADGLEAHVSTGKLAPADEKHFPQWGDWSHEWGSVWMRQCLHPDCDLDDYTNTKPEQGDK